MTEDSPPYLARDFICRICGEVFHPSEREAEALTELERQFEGIVPEQCSAVCEKCGAGYKCPECDGTGGGEQTDDGVMPCELCGGSGRTVQ